jgi:hypothetical protein
VLVEVVGAAEETPRLLEALVAQVVVEVELEAI